MNTLITTILDIFCDTHLHCKWIADIVISECITLNFTEINDCSTISINKEIHRLINLYTNVIQHNNMILRIFVSAFASPTYYPTSKQIAGRGLADPTHFRGKALFLSFHCVWDM